MSPVTYSTHFVPEIVYPESDGVPFGDSEFQLCPLIYAIAALKSHFRARHDVYVCGDMFLYYEEGKPSSVVAPDVFVVIGAENHKRNSYFLWKEPKAPDFILEITSKGTKATDQGSKFGLYQYLGVAEYFCFDPTFDYLHPPLKGFRLEDGEYKAIKPTKETPAHIILESVSLGLSLQLLDGDFRFLDSATGRVIETYDEIRSDRDEARIEHAAAVAQLEREQAAREQAEQRIRKLEAKLVALSQK